jgi:hypothetical protein
MLITFPSAGATMSPGESAIFRGGLRKNQIVNKVMITKGIDHIIEYNPKRTEINIPGMIKGQPSRAIMDLCMIPLLCDKSAVCAINWHY